jgi:hypothetical protein
MSSLLSTRALGFMLGGCASLSAQTPAPAPAPAPVPDSQLVPEGGARIEGFLHSEFIARTAGSDHDLDETSFFGVDYSDPRYPWMKAHVSARLSIDLDGQQPGSVFDGLSDIHDQAVDFKLYDAYVSLGPPGSYGTLRIGRQLAYETPVIVHYDGLDFRTHPTGDAEFSAGVYGGIPVRLYQDQSESRSLVGVFAEERPWHGGRARIDWMHVEDDQLAESGNGILALGLWQAFENGWSAEGQYSRLEDSDRDLRLHAQWTSPNAGFSASATYYQLFDTQDALPADIDPYTAILMALFPYRQYGLTLTTELSENAELDLAADARRVSNSGDLGEFNRDWERYRATLVLRRVMTSDFDLSLFDDLWDGDDRDVSSWGLDVAYDTREQWKFGAGTYYSLYKYDIFQNSERDDVRTWYARADCKLSKSLALEFSYDFEDDQQDQYNVLRGGVLWRF